ncbi:sugar phosphate nucleotidyltransferase [Phaeodactylibacter luteus]|uniref:Nucleotidyltransferase n=1 Tax=Phaeodactylibacter luteus TaxID=1564516 RepID=A0A5C6RM10_9BACT|nr:sugar phosphate nucleotidyltransferase [Phaeodactylibacter luteus]TXB63293.1 nucleotidyltransferase [Phaeodactylibacter luteus]
MKIIIPMAGRGSRLRPHTLTIPKPLLPVAGKPIVQRIVEDLAEALSEPVEEVAFIIGDFGKAAEEQLRGIAAGIGAKASIYTQDEPLGPGHAVLCAKPSLSGNCIVAFADTLFKANFAFDPSEDGIIWVQRVEDPSSFGVVKTNEANVITEFVEKSPTFVSDMAIVGLYYFRDGDRLRDTLQHIVEEDIRDKGEYQLTTALELLKNGGVQFRPSLIEEWLDCGNKDNVVATNRRMLQLKDGKEALVADSVMVENAVIIPPCYIGENTVIRNSVVGPHVSLGHNSTVEQSVISDAVIQNETQIRHANISKAMLGNFVSFEGEPAAVSIGDYSEHK